MKRFFALTRGLLKYILITLKNTLIPKSDGRIALNIFLLTMSSIVLSFFLNDISEKINNNYSDYAIDSRLTDKFVQKHDLVNLYGGLCTSSLSS